jgi:hypothetical protein
MRFIQLDVHIPFVEMILVSLFVVSFLSFKRNYDNMRSLVPSLFITFLTTLVFWGLALCDQTYVIMTALLFVVSIFLVYMDKEQG